MKWNKQIAILSKTSFKVVVVGINVVGIHFTYTVLVQIKIFNQVKLANNLMTKRTGTIFLMHRNKKIIMKN